MRNNIDLIAFAPSLLRLQDLQFFYLLHVVYISNLVHLLLQFLYRVVKFIQFEITLQLIPLLSFHCVTMALPHQLVITARYRYQFLFVFLNVQLFCAFGSAIYRGGVDF